MKNPIPNWLLPAVVSIGLLLGICIASLISLNNKQEYKLGAAPSGYTITANPVYVTSPNKTQAGFVLSTTGNVAGFTYNYSVTSSAGTPTITGSGTLAGSPQTIRTDVSSLATGTLTWSASVTNISGEQGSGATATAPYFSSAYSGYTPGANDPFMHSPNGSVLNSPGSLLLLATTSTGNVTIPTNATSVTVWGTGVLSLGGTTTGGTVATPSTPTLLPVSGGSLTVSGGSINAVFGG